MNEDEDHVLLYIVVLGITKKKRFTEIDKLILLF